MSVPVKKLTKGKVGRRNSHSALKKTVISRCSNCNEPIKSHCACSNCGTYKGKKSVKIKAVKTTKAKTKK